MASWRKLLARMVADPDPRSYSYEEAAGILRQLGFAEPSRTGGSHRKFRLEIEDPDDNARTRGIIVGLVQSGKGNLKPKYITQMIRTLRENKLLPDL